MDLFHKLNTAILYWSSDLQEVKHRFDIYKKVIPLFLDAKSVLFNVKTIQRICDTARDHKDWSACHIAVSLDFMDLLTHDIFNPLLDVSDKDGLCPLLMAVKSGSTIKTKEVLAAGGSLESKDSNGNNPFHLSANCQKSSAQLIDTLVASLQDNQEHQMKLINLMNNENNTPLHLACLADNQEAVLALLNNGADLSTMGKDGSQEANKKRTSSDKDFRAIMKEYSNQLYLKDIINGGSLLHWSVEKHILRACIKAGCDIKSKDFNGNSALHIMIKHQRFECVVCLLSYGADVQERDLDGNEPIHLAAISGCLPTLKALLVFGADYTSVNSSGDTPWSLILKSHQSGLLHNHDKERNMLLYTLHQLGANGPASLDEKAKEFEWKPKVAENNKIFQRGRHLLDHFLNEAGKNLEDSKKGGLRVLSLDGGGLRGLILTKVLSAINKASRVPITELFDWIGGTSTGGMLVLALASGFSPEYCQGMYFRVKDEIFVGKKPLDDAPVENFMKRELNLGIKTMASLPPKPRISVTGTQANRFPAELHLFTNYQRPSDILGLKEDLPLGLSPASKPDEQEIWRAARSTIAAPGLFRPCGQFLDGGFIANNPTLDLLTEINERNCALRAVGREKEIETIGLVVSIGVGDNPIGHFSQ